MAGASTVSVIVCCRGNRSGPMDIVAAIARQTYPAELTELIVVNNQRSGRREITDSLGRLSLPYRWRVVQEPRAGLSRARNAGVLAATGDYVVISDPDIVPSTDWIGALMSAHAATGAFCVGGSAWSRFDGPPAMTLTKGLRECHGPVDWPAERIDVRAPYWITGCNLSFHRDTALREVGLFRADLGRIRWWKGDCEDLEFVCRATRSSYRAVIEPAARVEHPVGRRETTPWYFIHQGAGHGWSLARMELTAPLWATPARPATAALAAALYYLARHRRDSPGTAAAVSAVREFAVFLAYTAERIRLSGRMNFSSDRTGGARSRQQRVQEENR